MRVAAKWIRVLGVVAVSLLTIDLCAADEAADAEKYGRPTFTLRVQDAAGRPIQNFDYARNGGRVETVQRLANGQLPEVQTVFNSNGVARVVIYNTRNEVTLFVGAPGYVAKPTLIPFDPPPTEVVVTLERAGTVKGQIVDSLGRPVAGARIWLGSVPKGGHHGLPQHIMDSDSMGRIASDRIPAGETIFGIAHPDFVSDDFERHIDLDRVNKLSFVMVAAATLHGSILLGSQTPTYADVYVYIGSVDDTKVTDYKVAQCTDGKFVVKGIVPGSNQVDFRASQPKPGFSDRIWTVTDEIALAERDKQDVDIRIPTGTSSLTGRLLFDGTPMTHGLSAYVTLNAQRPGRALKIGMPPNDEGDYAFDSIPAGVWTVTAGAWDDQAKKSYRIERQISLTETESLRLDLDLPEVKPN